MRFGDLFHEREAKTVSVDLSIDNVLRTIEWLEYLPQIAFRNANTSVFD
jgi:hypothetical protein